MAKSRSVLNSVTLTTFGELLRYFRERAKLSQRELAQRVGYHYSYISRLEKNERILNVSILQKLFIPALKLEKDPESVTRLLELAAINLNEPAAINDSGQQPAKSPALSVGLPVSLTPLLGRESESATLFQILLNEEVRLVTLIGPPGVGKTRLALHIAEQLAPKFSDGVVFVDLMPTFETDQVIPALSTALGIHESSAASVSESVKSALGRRNLLIVMDNFEQVLDAAPQLLPLLGHAPRVKILVTSREALRLRGEQEFPLAPLPVPDEKTNQSVLDFPSVQLFLQRARSAKPDFQLKGEDASRAAEICRRLDGLPLAIELAAARIRTLNLAAMLEQFDRRFEWLAHGGRDLPVWRQTLWGAVEWSYTLLSGQERALFNRLSVFAGGWRLEAAEGICSDELLCIPSDILNLLMQLMDKSLITIDAETGRYHFLETLREFAFEKLKAGNDLEYVRQRHAEYYMEFMKAAFPHLNQGSNQAHWLDQIEDEHNNLHAVLAWIIETPTRAATATDFILTMCNFWIGRSYFTEARRWLNKILALDPTSTIMRAKLLRCASDFHRIQGDYDGAFALEEEGLAISKTLNYEAGIYAAMDGLAILAGIKKDYAHATELLEQAIIYRRQTGDTVRLTPTLNNLATAHRRLGNLERAGELYTEAISVNQENGNLMSLGHALNGLSEVHLELKEYANAVGLQHKSISIRHQLGDMKGIAFSLGSLAISMYHLNAAALATQLESASQKIFQELGVIISPATRAENENFIAQLNTELGDTAFKEAWSSGQVMSLEQAVELAINSTSQKMRRKRKAKSQEDNK